MHQKRPRPQLSVGIVLANHFTLSSFALFTDLLRLAADDGDLSRQVRVGWTVMNHGAAPVRSSCGVSVQRTSALIDPRKFDYLMIVGGILHAGPQINAATEAYLHEASRCGVPLIGMCTGSFILSRIGEMKDRCACVSWYHYQDFVDEFPNQPVVADRIFLVDKDRITLPGGAGAADLSLHLIERHIGNAAAQKAQEVLQFERMRTSSCAPPHPPVGMRVSNTTVRRALLLMEQNLARPLSIRSLAGKLQRSTRQLERLFLQTVGMTPGDAYRQVRMRYAAWLLTHSGRSITDVALSAGFADCAHFSRQYRGNFGLPPSRGRSAPIAAPTGECAGLRVFS